ncbi:MAG: MerR family DNA-binding transcriptional regulator [Minisyncoccia bacterium]
MNYPANQLAKIAGVSIRALHHYDAIGLLSPGRKSKSEYRAYAENDGYRTPRLISVPNLRKGICFCNLKHTYTFYLREV